MRNKEQVTVCITTYNRDFLIESAILRVFKQSYENIQVIVVDDCSKDNTKQVCERVVNDLKGKGKNITYIRHEINKGLASARNTAIANSSGKYFTFIDDDDSWDLNFIESFVDLASNYDSNWCFCCGVKNINGNRVSELIPEFNDYLKNYFVQGYTPPVASQFYFTQTLIDLGGYREDIGTGVDHDLWLTLSVNNIKIKGLEKALAIPNQDPSVERMTTNRDKRLNKLADTLEKWRPIIVENFGNEFYDKFSNSYIIREKKSFFNKTLKSKGLREGMKYYINNRSLYNSKEVLRTLTRHYITEWKLLKQVPSMSKTYEPSIKC